MNFINNNYHPQQNQGWNQQQRPNYQGNYQGNNFNNFNNQPSLRDLVSGQAKIMEGLSRKLASNDKMLENINNRMDSFSAIKNQHSFNKIIESQIAQLAAAVSLIDKVKILRQPEDLKTINLVDIQNAAYYCIQPSAGGWID